jgi:hypothetical protein
LVQVLLRGVDDEAATAGNEVLEGGDCRAGQDVGQLIVERLRVLLRDQQDLLAR